MLSARPNLSMTRLLSRFLILSALTFAIAPAVTPSFFTAQAQAPISTEIIPLSQIRPGMQGYAYTIFAGDQVEKFDLEVIGIMPNFLGPRQTIILVQLKGPKVEHTGVVAGMSGSPVYFEGKLAGALSLKLGVFTKEPIGGVTPIEDIIRPQPQASAQSVPSDAPSQQLPLPQDAASRTGLPTGSALEPIETPLVFSGYQPEALRQFAGQLQSFGFVAAQGGTAAPKSDDGHLLPGDMAGMVLVQGDTSISSACTVTAIRADQVYLCGHPFLSLGDVQFPMARTEVVTTLSSELASTKIINVGSSIGTITGDHLTAVTGKLGAPPPLIPVDLTLSVGGAEKKLHFEMVNHPKLTPLLVGLTVFNGLTQNSLYGEGTTLHLSGEVVVHGHAPVQIENTFAPGDAFSPDGLPIAINIQSVFNRLFTNTRETPVFDRITLRVESVPGRQSFSIESAWLEKGEAAPGETLRVRVLLRPYRGPARVEETTVRVPEQATRGTTLRVLVTDGDMLNRASRGFSFAGAGSSNASLDQLIALLNRERRNDRLYVGLFVPTPTILWDDKELPNIPQSQINVIDGRPTPGTVQILRESLASESSIALGGPVSGVISLNLQIR
jgi:SpoIVB peptidase S55